MDGAFGHPSGRRSAAKLMTSAATDHRAVDRIERHLAAGTAARANKRCRILPGNGAALPALPAGQAGRRESGVRWRRRQQVKSTGGSGRSGGGASRSAPAGRRVPLCPRPPGSPGAASGSATAAPGTSISTTQPCGYVQSSE